MSMQAWIHRARDLGILSSEGGQRLYREFRSRGWHITEPGDAYPAESSTRLQRLILRALQDDLIGPERASELLGQPLTQFMAEVERQHEGLALRG